MVRRTDLIHGRSCDDDRPPESSSANANGAVFQSSRDEIAKPRRTGYSACAREYDDNLCRTRALSNVTEDFNPTTEAHTLPRSRGAMRPRFAPTPSGKEGTGKAGCTLHPQSRARKDEAHERSHHRPTGTPSFPCAMELAAYFELFPVTGLYCHRRRADYLAHRPVGRLHLLAA
jgi:hypothetical protein